MKAEAKEAERKKKLLDRRKRMLERDKREAEVQGDLILIYPLVTYKEQFYIEDQFPIEERRLKDEIESKKKEAQANAGDQRKK